MGDGGLGGTILHGEVYSPDAHGGVGFSMFNGAGTAYTIGANDHFFLTDVIASLPAGGNLAIVNGTTDTAGLRALKVSLPAGASVLEKHFESPVEFARGVTPKLFADAGTVAVQIQGRITNA